MWRARLRRSRRDPYGSGGGYSSLAAFTFTVWDEPRSATGWAYRPGPHRTMLDCNAREVLMEASGFWRFAVLGSHGTVDGRDPLAALRPHIPAPAGVANH